MASNTRIILSILILFSVYISSNAVPLSTRSRWIIDDKTGKRVKLACANLVGHTESLLPEGVSSQPLSDIARRTVMMGFNCIRLTYAVYMFTQYSQLTVAENLEKLGLNNAITGISRHNPHLLGLTLVDAQKAVIDEFSSQGIMFILDNQVSKPMWCCADNDGNGFWGDKYFDPQEWLDSLNTVAKRYKDNPMVIGMSLRNEIRGPNQNESAWYEYIEEGANAVHKANPNVLVIVSGLSYAIRLDFLKERPLKLNFKRKLVYETHRYAFSEGNSGQFANVATQNQFCKTITDEVDDKFGFLGRGRKAAPIFVSEFGYQEAGNVISDNTFFACFVNYLALNDFEWALWTLQGSYIFRQGRQNPEELYGMFSFDWDHLRSPDSNARLYLIQQPLQDPVSKTPPYLVLFHPMSGKCLRVDNGEIHLSDCFGMARLRRRGHSTSSAIELVGNENLCLTATGDGLPVAFTQDCHSKKSSWKQFDNYQLAYDGDQGEELCLEWDPYYALKLVTKPCIVNGNGYKPDNPQRQWFSLVLSSAQ